MSPGSACAINWRENTRSNPTSLASAVSTALSSARHRAGSAAPARRAGEQRRERRRVGGAPAVAEREQSPSVGEPLGHRRRPRRRSTAPSRSSVARWSSPLTAPLPTADAARSREQRLGVALVAFDERDRGSRCPRSSRRAPLSTTAMAVPACTSTRSPGPTGPTRFTSICSTPTAVRTDAAPVTSTVDHLGQRALVGAGDARAVGVARRVRRRQRADRDARSTRA